METARSIVDVIAAKLGSDVLLLDITGVTLIADYFVIATGDSERQLQAIKEQVLLQLKADHGVAPLSIEGTATSGWVLLDYGSVVVHLFSARQRRRYRLEEFWSNARTVVRIA